MLDHQYSLRAQEVGTGRIRKARELRDAMRAYVPTDAEFEEAFATARVSRAYLARYYLRALDKTLKNDPFPEYVANDDETAINLEHILPATPTPAWKIDSDIQVAAQKLLGNMTLLRASKNRGIGNEPFGTKRKVYEESSYAITNEIAKYADWSIDRIRERQKMMAKIAVKTWPLEFGQ
jgi:hypothetical protein